ncbi:ABC transporter ATP-binding protein [Clostridium sporogenes]|nr:ABC transporter ATP-binding protein [Clostridium sporogenes]NFS24982.1 ABC transporter ATP-binding protein [Clostridium sporogenes]
MLMLEMVQNIWFIAEKDGKKLIPTIILSVFDSILNSGMYYVMIVVLLDLTQSAFTIYKLKNYSFILLAIFFGRCLVQSISYSKAMYDGPMISQKLRLKLGNHIRSLNLGFFNKNSQGRLNAILTTDINDFETILTHCICDLVKVITFTFFSLIISMLIDWKFGIAMAIIVCLALPLLSMSGKISVRNSTKTHEANEDLVSRLVEYIEGIKTFRLYNLIGSKFERLDESLQNLKKQATNAELSVLPFTLSFSAVTSLLIPVALILGTYFLTVQNMEPVEFLAVLLIAISVASMMTSLSVLYPQVRSLNKAAENIRVVLNEKPFGFEQETADLANKDIQFSKVSFRYTKEKEVIHDISFKAKNGTTTALIGPSGSGKTTIVSLLSRFWDVNKGEITIGETDIQKISPDALASNMAVVFQDIYLLQDTVLNNIKVGKPEATMEEVIEAAKAAHCHDFVKKMEKGYNTIIGEGGSTLSGGERQRISIARALLKNAPVVLLDETTSSLDADNEQEIQKAFARLMKGKTVFVIAHRLNTIMGANNILVLDKGTIKESGNHSTLMKLGGWYAQMVEEQKMAEQWSAKE